MPNVLVFAESRGAELRKVALEAVTAGRAFVDAMGGGEGLGERAHMAAVVAVPEAVIHHRIDERDLLLQGRVPLVVGESYPPFMRREPVRLPAAEPVDERERD